MFRVKQILVDEYFFITNNTMNIDNSPYWEQYDDMWWQETRIESAEKYLSSLLRWRENTSDEDIVLVYKELVLEIEQWLFDLQSPYNNVLLVEEYLEDICWVLQVLQKFMMVYGNKVTNSELQVEWIEIEMSLRESLERREDADMNQVYKNPFRWNTEKSLQTKVLSAIYYLDHMSQGLN